VNKDSATDCNQQNLYSHTKGNQQVFHIKINLTTKKKAVLFIIISKKL
jgi:hypothetical protein